MDLFSEKAIRKLTPGEIRLQVESIASGIHQNNYALGGFIQRVRSDGLWKKWGKRTFQSFGDWCWAILGFKDRKAEELSKIHGRLQELEVSGKVKSELVNQGWTKLRFLSRVVDEDNAKEWLDKSKMLSSRALEAEVRIASGDPDPDTEDGDDPDPEPKPKRVRMGLEFDHPDDFRFVTDIMAVIERRTGERSNGRIISMMATAYAAMHVRDDEGGMAVEVERMLQAMERDYGIQLGIMNPVHKKGRKKGVKKKVKKA